jgi:hypothetical protein
MIPEQVIWQAANLLIREHGADAELVAARAATVGRARRKTELERSPAVMFSDLRIDHLSPNHFEAFESPYSSRRSPLAVSFRRSG